MSLAKASVSVHFVSAVTVIADVSLSVPLREVVAGCAGLLLAARCGGGGEFDLGAHPARSAAVTLRLFSATTSR